MDNYSCAKCRLTFSTKGNYTKHCLTKKHKRAGAQVVYECKKCNFSTAYKTRYEEHLLSYKCRYHDRVNRIDKRKFKTMLAFFKNAYIAYKGQLSVKKRLEHTPFNDLSYSDRDKVRSKSYLNRLSICENDYLDRRDSFRPLMEQWLKLINLSINTRIKFHLFVWLSKC